TLGMSGKYGGGLDWPGQSGFRRVLCHRCLSLGDFRLAASESVSTRQLVSVGIGLVFSLSYSERRSGRFYGGSIGIAGTAPAWRLSRGCYFGFCRGCAGTGKQL